MPSPVHTNGTNEAARPQRVTIQTLHQMGAAGAPFACLTCYDAAMARWLGRGSAHAHGR